MICNENSLLFHTVATVCNPYCGQLIAFEYIDYSTFDDSSLNFDSFGAFGS